MNKYDKAIFKALKFFTDNTRAEATVVMQNNNTQYRQLVPEYIEKLISEKKYILAHDKTMYFITHEGNEELRKLEAIESRDNQVKYQLGTVLISISAILISFGSLLISLGGN